MKKINHSHELVNGSWQLVNPTEEVATTHEQQVLLDIESIVFEQQQARQYLAETDVKVTKYRDQIELVELGVLDNTSLSEEEYTAMIIERQAQRDLFKQYNQQIYDLENPIVNTEEATPYEET